MAGGDITCREVDAGDAHRAEKRLLQPVRGALDPGLLAGGHPDGMSQFGYARMIGGHFIRCSSHRMVSGGGEHHLRRDSGFFTDPGCYFPKHPCRRIQVIAWEKFLDERQLEFSRNGDVAP